MTDSTKGEKEDLYRDMVLGDAELSAELMDGPASTTRWMTVFDDGSSQED